MAILVLLKEVALFLGLSLSFISVIPLGVMWFDRSDFIVRAWEKAVQGEATQE